MTLECCLRQYWFKSRENLRGVKIESTSEGVMLINNYDGTHVIDLAIHSTSSFKSPLSFPFASFAQDLPSNAVSLYKLLYMSIADNHTRSKKPPIYHA